MKDVVSIKPTLEEQVLLFEEKLAQGLTDEELVKTGEFMPEVIDLVWEELESRNPSLKILIRAIRGLEGLSSVVLDKFLASKPSSLDFIELMETVPEYSNQVWSFSPHSSYSKEQLCHIILHCRGVRELAADELLSRPLVSKSDLVLVMRFVGSRAHRALDLFLAIKSQEIQERGSREEAFQEREAETSNFPLAHLRNIQVSQQPVWDEDLVELLTTGIRSDLQKRLWVFYKENLVCKSGLLQITQNNETLREASWEQLQGMTLTDRELKPLLFLKSNVAEKVAIRLLDTTRDREILSQIVYRFPRLLARVSQILWGEYRDCNETLCLLIKRVPEMRAQCCIRLLSQNPNSEQKKLVKRFT